MSGAVKSVGRSVGKLFGGGGKSAPLPMGSPSPEQVKQMIEAQTPKPREATPEERVVALRRRRGSRALLSQERMDAEAGLAGEQTTLGG